jgi:hypothetical protein
MQPIPDEFPVSPSVTPGFMVAVLFLLGLLVFDLLSGKAAGAPAEKYWIVLAAQAGAAVLFVAR